MTMHTSFHVIDLMSVVAVDVHICVQRRGIGSSREGRAARIPLGGLVVVCCVAATSCDRSGISASPPGFRDKASATVLRTPGMCSTRNRYHSDFSLMFRNRGLGVSSRARSPSTSSSGLWSTTTVRFGHPNVKCRVLLRASTTASASPSMGAYHDSAPCVKRLPISTTFQPDLQQNGRASAQSQCFWDSQYPSPS